jgi:hypothetical protein
MKRFDSLTRGEDEDRELELHAQESDPSPQESTLAEGLPEEDQDKEGRDEDGVVFVDVTEKYRGMGFIIGLEPPWPTCPLCGFLDVKKVFYGPANELPDPADYIHAGEEVLAREDLLDPDWHCPNCGHTWERRAHEACRT